MSWPVQRKLKENNASILNAHLSVCTTLKPTNYVKLLSVILYRIFTRKGAIVPAWRVDRCRIKYESSRRFPDKPYDDQG